ncbi:MAG: protein kinase [Gemmatimonadales bacterium]
MTDETQLNLQQALGSQYRIERELGRGGMRSCFWPRTRPSTGQVAVKVVHRDSPPTGVIASRFLAEARTIARLRHPNIVAVHAAGEVDGHLYYVMDYLPGETLRQRLTRDGRLDPELTRRILSDIAAALDAASAAGVVHRDLKPENILLEGDPKAPRALLTDFGIARLTEASGGHTGPGAVMGTPAYMSPEQASGDEVDGRSDLYALGVVGYEMLAGAPPFQGQHRVVISKQILDRPTDLATIRPDVPAAVSDTIMRALEKAPDDRWPTGQALRASLWGDRPRRRAPLLRPSRLALGAALVAAAALLITALVKRPDPGGPPLGLDPRHSLLVLPFDNLRQDTSLDWLRDGSVNMLTLALSQWRDLSVVDQHRVHDLLEGERHDDGEAIGLEQARRLARAGGAWTVVLGDFSRTNDSLYLVARTYDVASGRRLEVISVEARESEDVRQLFDRLAARLLDLSGAPSEGRSSLASVTTESVEAYRAYLQGVDDLHHWRLTDASQALVHAVEIDSTFSLAHFRLAVARGWMSPFDTLGVRAIRRAALTSERLPDRERGLIQAYLAFIEGDYPGSLSVYERLVARDPADIEAWYGLADASFHGGYAGRDVQTLSRSLHSFRRVVELDSAYALAYEHLGQLLTDAASASGRSRCGRQRLRPSPDRPTRPRPARLGSTRWPRRSRRPRGGSGPSRRRREPTTTSTRRCWPAAAPTRPGRSSPSSGRCTRIRCSRCSGSSTPAPSW